MVKQDINIHDDRLVKICGDVKALISEKKFSECDQLIKQAMSEFPHAPHPHNLMGIQLEKKGDHVMAMKHFRAAWALDPTYLPAKFNMDQYADFYEHERVEAYMEEDCVVDTDKDLYKIEYNEDGIGHIVKRRKKNQA